MNITGKGVICAIWDDERMPTDMFGNRAEVIFDPLSTLKRMILSRFDEQYFSATVKDIECQCKELIANNRVTEAKDLLFKLYQVGSPKMHEAALEFCPTEEAKIAHTLEAVNEGLQIWFPQDNPNIGSQVIKDLMNNFRLPYGPVTYIGDSGKRVTTKKPVLIGSLYVMALEKIGDDWGATSIPKRQHHGIPGKLTDADKNTLPWRDQAFKVFGESEVRLLLGTLDPNFVASLITLPNSPAMCMDVARSVLTAEKPTDIYMVADYRKHAETPGRAVQYFNHMLAVSGIKIGRGEESK